MAVCMSVQEVLIHGTIPLQIWLPLKFVVGEKLI